MHNPKIHILDTLEKLGSFFKTTHISEYIILDVETDSTREKTAKLYGIGLCFDETDAFYIPIRDKHQQLLWTEEVTQRIANSILQLCKQKKLIGHNIIYDVLILKNNWNINLVDYIYADTILLKHCIDEEPPFGLKDIAVKYLGAWADKAKQALLDNIKLNGGRTTKEHMEMFKADTAVLGEYCAWDVVLTYLLFKKFMPLLKEQGLEDLFFKEEVMPLYKECVIPMKDKGFPIDVEYFTTLKSEIEQEIVKLEAAIQLAIADNVEDYTAQILDEKFPLKITSTLTKALAVHINAPHTKTAMKKYIPHTSRQHHLKMWITSGGLLGLSSELIEDARTLQKDMWHKKFPEENYIFNINSNKQLCWLLFEKLGIASTEKTESGAPKLDADILEKLSGEHEFCDTLIEYKKLQKLLSTYIEGILDRQYEGVVYASFLMFGTTSGRFSSRDPNLQNLPRVKDEESNLSPLVLKYVNAIKKGFVAGKGYKICNSDFSQLEPCAFAAASGDKKLQAIFHNKWDLYSSIAIEAFGLNEYSADKKSSMYLKNHRPEMRQKAKVVALAVVYGAEAGRIAQVLKCSREEAQKIIDDYLEAYPGLVEYMKACDKQVATQGFIKNSFGRVRHLPEAKSIADKYDKRILDARWAKRQGVDDLRWKLKNYLNNGKNFPIQSTAAHVVNRSMIATTRAFKEHNIEGYIAAQIHDELTCIVREDQAELAKKLLKDAMEQTTKLDVPLSAEPVIGYNWAESK